MPRYKIFATEDKIVTTGEDVTIEQTYPAFTIVTASEQAAEALRNWAEVN